MDVYTGSWGHIPIVLLQRHFFVTKARLGGVLLAKAVGSCGGLAGGFGGRVGGGVGGTLLAITTITLTVPTFTRSGTITGSLLLDTGFNCTSRFIRGNVRHRGSGFGTAVSITCGLPTDNSFTASICTRLFCVSPVSGAFGRISMALNSGI